MLLKQKFENKVAIFDFQTEFNQWVQPQLYDPLDSLAYNGVVQFLKIAHTQETIDNNLRILLQIKTVKKDEGVQTNEKKNLDEQYQEIVRNSKKEVKVQSGLRFKEPEEEDR